MPSPKTKSHDKEIDSVLTRLHSGSRFIAYTERRSSSKPTDEDRVHNALRNLSPPDEVHAELGRALAFSYVTSLQSIKDFLVDHEKVNNADVQAAVDRGMRIIESLVCGEEVSTDDKREVQKEYFHKGNYASMASSFFDHLVRLVFVRDDAKKGDDSRQEQLCSFVKIQWHQWCIRCEELAYYTSGNGVSLSGGGGYLAFNACLRGYASISYISGEYLSDNRTGTLFQSLNQTSSRKFWIRLCVSKAAELMKSVTAEPSNVLLECLSSDGVEVVNPRGAEIDKLWVDSLSPLFYQCVLRARPETTKEQADTTVQEKHSERQLLLHEVLRGCSLLLRNVKDDDSSVMNQIAQMVQYLTTSLHSYFGQITSNFFACNHLDTIEFAYEWLRGVCDLNQLLMSKSSCGNSNTVIGALSKSCETILRYVLPQTSSITISQVSFDVISVYSALVEIVSGLPRSIINKMADAKLAFSLGTLSLSLSDDEEVKMLCNLLLGVFGSLDKGNVNSVDMLWIGGMLCSLGNVFHPRTSIHTIELKALGDKLVRSGHALSLSKQIKIGDDIRDDLVTLLVQSQDDKSGGGPDYQFLLSTVTSSIANADDDAVLLYKWKRRPLSMTEQNAALLIGLSQLHIALPYAASTEDMQIIDPFTLLDSLLTCHPRMSARVVPSLVDVTRVCITNASNGPMLRLLLKTIKFIASSAVVVDPNGAFIAWAFVSSLTTDSTPPVVRSSVLSILPEMCASNKKLRSRIRSIIGKSLASTDPVIRSAAMASLCKLAEKDLLRDVEEIVGWIQVGLKDEETAVSYYAILSLKYLVSNEELDFDLVMRVLEKRLGLDLDDTNNVLTVLGDDLVLEAFVVLLEEAGFEEMDDDEPDDNEGQCVSEQSVKAVNLLVNLALLPESISNLRVQTSILKSLSCFGPQLLGIDADAIRTWSAHIADDETIAVKKRYEDIKHIALLGLEVMEKLSSFSEHDETTGTLRNSISTLMSTLLQFEEEAHGSSLYRGSMTMEKTSEKEKVGSRVSKAALASLPTDESILEMYDDEPSTATATAVMCCSTDINQSAEALLTRLSDLFVDFTSERLSEPLQAVQLSALVECIRGLKRSINDETEGQQLFLMAMNEIQGWTNTSEFAYVALALFSIDSGSGAELHPELTDEATSIKEKILHGFDTLLFDSKEIKFLCMCLVASKLSHSADSRVTGIIDSIQKHFEGLGEWQVPFGIVFGLSVLLNQLTQDGNLTRTDPSDTWRRKQARRIISLFLSTLNNCLSVIDDTVLLLVKSIEDGTPASSLEESCKQVEELFVKERSLDTLRSVMLGLGKSFQSIAALDVDLSTCILEVIEKLPWKSGKAFVLPAAYKSCLDLGVRDQNDLSNKIASISSLVPSSTDDPYLGHMIYAIANLSQLRSRAEMMDPDTDLVKSTVQAIMDPGREISGDRKQMAILSALSLVGEIHGLSPASSGLHTYTKKDLVGSTAAFLKMVATNDAEDSKTRDVAMICLGLMSGLKTSDRKVKKSLASSKNDRTVNFSDILQAKEDTVMLSIFIRINAAHSTVTSTAYGEATRSAASRKLSVLLQSLKAIALRGNFSRVIEVVLNDSNKHEAELKTSCIELLTSQMESRRRIGFDGRGFLDLFTRLSKMSPDALHLLVGRNNVPTLMAAVADLIPQLPTSSGEDTLTNLWTLCRHDLIESSHAKSATEFFDGIKFIVASAESSAKKNVVSPAILRCIQKLMTSTFFEDMCQIAGPCMKSCESTFDAEKLWVAYAGCMNEIDATAISEYEVDNMNLFGMATCSSVLKQPSKVLRKTEVYISRHEWSDPGPELEGTDLRLILTSLVAFAPQYSSDSEMKVSTLSLFDLLLVKGIDMMSLEVLAVIVAFWWDSLQMNRLDVLETPSLQISTRSSLFLTRNLCFKMQAWSLDTIMKFFDMCIADLPGKLAVLCNLWKISKDVSNKASRVLSACAQNDEMDNEKSGVRRKRAMICLKNLVQLLNGGEP